MLNCLNFLILPPIPLWVYLHLVLHGCGGMVQTSFCMKRHLNGFYLTPSLRISLV